MSNNAKPVHRIRYGSVVAAIWANNSQSGYFFNTTFCRIYKDKDGTAWGESSSFEDRDLPALTKAAADAVRPPLRISSSSPTCSMCRRTLWCFCIVFAG